MSTLLRRDLAPVSDRAWEELDKEAAAVLRQCLVARRVVDTSGPHGWELSAVNLGRLESTDQKTPDGVGWGLRANLPLIETRVRFVLSLMELDEYERGCVDVDVDALQDAAMKAAAFEDAAVLNGFAKGRIKGIAAASSHKPVTLPASATAYGGAVADAVKAMRGVGIGGPYELILSTDSYYALMQHEKGGYPPHRVIQEMLGGDILSSPVVQGGLVLSRRGGDFELTLGVDFSLGFHRRESDGVELFLTESFAFRVLEPRAAVVLKPKG